MLDVTALEFLWQYMVHADREVIVALDAVDDANYFAARPISWGSLAAQVAHAVTADEVWLKRLQGHSVRYPSEPDTSTREGIIGRWHAVHRELLALLAAETPETLDGELSFVARTGKTFSVRRWAAMAHVADHATYHRGHLNTMIKNAGGAPTGVMLFTYAVSHGFGGER